MSITPTAGSVAAVYTTADRVKALLPPGAIKASVNQKPGEVTETKLAELIAEESRRIDGVLGAVGISTPFPDVESVTPTATPPAVVTKMVTDFVVGECHAIITFGNRSKGTPSAFHTDRAQAAEDMLIESPKTIGEGIVTAALTDALAVLYAPDDFLSKVFGTSGAQYGRMQEPYYRLANRNIISGSLRFVTSAGVEVRRSDGFPFLQGQDFSWLSRADGTLAVINAAAIVSAVGAGGGAAYRFSWLNLVHGQVRPAALPGVRF